MKSAFSVKERLFLVNAWKGSGLSARAFAAKRPGLTASLLANWHHHAFVKKETVYQEAETKASGSGSVRVGLELDVVTHARLSMGAAELSIGTGRHVSVEDYAAATLRHLLTGGAKPGRRIASSPG